MSNITPLLNEALKAHGSPAVAHPKRNFLTSDEFLKEAYRINSHIASLHDYLKSIRRSYLSASQPPRRAQLSRVNSNAKGQSSEERQYFTDSQRDQIDAESKQLLRELNGAIHNLSDAETLRQNTESTLSRRKFGHNGLGALGRWAAGGIGPEKSKDEELEEARANGVKAHRESVLWYLRRKLEACGEVQRDMMETRLTREVEKSKSVLYKTRGPNGAVPAIDTSAILENDKFPDGAKGAQMDDHEKKNIEQQLSPEQLQLFAQENHDMLKHYEDTLDQVRTAERSLIEISELQTTLASNLTMQAAHIDQLVADSFQTTENVGDGNKELKRATERKSTAKYVFYSSCAFSLVLVVWDFLV